MSLPSTLAIAPKASAVRSRGIRHNSRSLNKQSFQGSDEAHFAIPSGRFGQYLDTKQTYFSFKLKNTHGSNSLTLDKSAYAAIDRLEVYSGSNLLESIADYAVLVNLLQDVQCDSTARSSSLAVTTGTATNDAGLVLAAGESATFCIPFISSVLGPSCSRLLPNGQLVSDLRVIVTWQSKNNIGKSSAAGADNSYEITEAQIICSLVELESGVQKMIDQELGGKYVISSETFRSYNSMVNANDTVATILIPCKTTSLKTLFTVVRQAQHINNGDEPTLSSRAWLATTRWYYRVGAAHMPATPIMSAPEGYAELMKAFHMLSDSAGSSSINLADWTDVSGNTTGKHIFALNCEVFSGATGVIESGINTLAEQIFWEAEFPALDQAYVVTSFAHFDNYLVLGPEGLMTSTN